MGRNNLESDSDLFYNSLPEIDPSGEMITSETTIVDNYDEIVNFFHAHQGPAIAVISTVSILFLVLFVLILRSIFDKSQNPMAEFTRTQKRKNKQQAYVSSSNKLQTPENINECVRIFLERTR